MGDILIIKHGALGDIILAFPAFAAIRAAHKKDHITLLTTAPFVPLLKPSPWFNSIETDSRPSWWNIRGLKKLRRQLTGFDMVYDLQTSARSSWYYELAGRPLWSGIARGCALPHADPNRNRLHTRERLEGQLHDAGIFGPAAPELDWLTADIKNLSLPPDYIVFVPGAAAHRPEKCWPAAHFAALAAAQALPVVVVGGPEVARAVSGVIDVAGRTTLLELAAVLRGARLAVGNDTGPMHLAAALGVKSAVLFSAASDPALTAPRYPDGSWPVILRQDSLADLPVAQVLAALP